MEPLRTPEDIMSWGTFQVSTFMSAIWIVVGLGVLLWFQFFTNPNKHAQAVQVKFVKAFWNIVNLFLPKSKKKEHALYISKDKYKRITPIKTRKVWYFGEKSNKRKKHGFWGEEISHRIIIWLPNHDSDWSKRELNSGEKKRRRINK